MPGYSSCTSLLEELEVMELVVDELDVVELDKVGLSSTELDVAELELELEDVIVLVLLGGTYCEGTSEEEVELEVDGTV